jgi:hypothetical protein
MVLPGYPAAAANLWRWVDASAEDEAISAFLAGVAPIGRRPRLTDRDQTTLMVYAQRCALAAVRSRDGKPVVRAFEALALVKQDRVDEDRLLDIATLVAHAATYLSDRQRLSIVNTVLRVDPDVAEALSSEVDLADDVGYRELDTPAGRVFVEDESATFSPDADLVAAAYRAAEMLEADRYEVTSVGIGQTLHPIWVLDAVNPDASAATERLTGCAHVHAGRGNNEVSVYVAEAASVQDAEAIGTAADSADSPQHPQLGQSVGRLCAILYAGAFDPAAPLEEDKSTLDRFRVPLRSVLDGT